MEKIEWTQALSVGVAEIDEQHQKLFSIIQQLRQAPGEELDKKSLLTVLSELVDYSDYHFRTEDNYMIDNSYPLFMSHRKEHLAFIKKTGEFIAALQKDETALPEDILGYLCNWWEQHIVNSDLKYARYIRSQA